MAQTYPLDTVVRIVDSINPIDSPDKQIVVIDVESRQAIEVVHQSGKTQLRRVGMFGFLKDRKYFLVANNSDPRNEAEGKLPVFSLRDFTRKWTLGLEVSYLANCSPGNEVKVAERLYPGAHPGAALNESITRWMKDFAGSQPAILIENYYSKKIDLESNIASRALTEIGLNLQVAVRLEGEHEALRPIKIGPIHFPVRAKDDEAEQDLKLTAEIQVDPQNQIYAILYRHQTPRLQDLMKSEVRKYFAMNISPHALYAEIQSSALKQRLIDHLNSVLRTLGRRIGFLSLGQKEIPPDQKKPIEEFFETKADIVYDIQEYPEPVVIKNTVQMSLKDYGRFKNSGFPDLGSWIKKNLDEVIHQVLFDKRYIDLLIGFDPLETEIKDELSARAERIGYGIKQLITAPYLEPYNWLKNFTFKVEQTYEIKGSKYPVKLSVVVTAKIKALRDVEEYLNRRQSVPEEMKTAVVDEVTPFLHTIDPERFYLRFSFTDKPEEEPVEKLLYQSIKDRLIKDFKADILNITVDVGETELTLLYDQLRKTPGRFMISVPSYESRQIYDVVLSGEFRVESIHYDYWDTFQSTDTSIERIREHMESHLIGELSVVAHNQLAYHTRAEQKALEDLVSKLARERVLAEFGLVINITTFSRKLTGAEDLRKQQLRAIYELEQSETRHRAEEVIKTISSLNSKRLELIAVDARDEQISAVESWRDKLQGEIPIDAATTPSDFKLLSTSTEKSSQLEDFYSENSNRVRKLSSGSNGHEDSE